MAQGRFLSRTVAIDPQLAQLSMAAEMLYLKAIPHLDRDGICTGEPLALLGMISPFRFSEMQSQIAACIDEWAAVGLIIRYATPTMGMAIWFKGFAKQQKLQYQREAASQYPAPPGYIRTSNGLVPSTSVPWTADSGVLVKNPESTPKIDESRPQAEVKAKQQVQEQVQQQQQQQGQTEPAEPDSPAAAAVFEQVRQELANFGITGRILDELSSICPIADVRGWIEYTDTQERLINPIGYVIKQLRSHAPPPPPPEDPDSYEALKRRYVPSGFEDIIEH